jgi:uncharacterized metal-binding protein
MQKKMTLPKVGLFACFSGGSNTGSLAGLAALEVLRRLGDEVVGICSLPAVLNQVPRQSTLVKQMKNLIVIDGCRNSCASHLLAEKGIKVDLCLNLETDLGFIKQGPFSSLAFTEEEIRRIADALITAGEKKGWWARVKNKQSDF